MGPLKKTLEVEDIDTENMEKKNDDENMRTPLGEVSVFLMT